MPQFELRHYQLALGLFNLIAPLCSRSIYLGGCGLSQKSATVRCFAHNEMLQIAGIRVTHKAPQFEVPSRLCHNRGEMSESDDLRELREKNVCPNCGKPIPEGGRQVYGKGVFCSLGCVAEYKGAELVERHKKRLAAAERHRNS